MTMTLNRDTYRWRQIRLWIIRVLCLGLLLASPVAAEDESSPVADVRIKILDTSVNTGLWESVAQNLIPLKKGDDFSLEDIETAIRSLTASQLFEFIHVPDPEQTDQGIVVLFDLTPFSRIKDIRIKNAFPLFQREVLNVLSIDTGDAYRKQMVETQADRVKQLFRRQGFAHPKVWITAEQDPSDGHYTVDINIDKGQYQKIRRVRFLGNDNISASRLKLTTKVWRSTLLFGTARRFVTKDMNDDNKKLTALYRNRGFADIRVEAEAVPDETTRDVDINFIISEGPHYKIAFTGNTALSDRTLKKELVLSKDGNRNNFALRKSIRNLKNRYAVDGFPDAAVRDRVTDDTAAAPSRRKVEILIDEGHQYRVAELRITGNQTISETAIRENILTPDRDGIFQATILDEDAAAVRTLYLKEGFSHVQIDKQVRYQDDDNGKTRQVRIELAIREGSRARVETVSFSGLSAIPREAALAGLALLPGKFFDPTQLETDTTALHQVIAESGYPHVSITAKESFSQDRARVHIQYDVQQGPQVRVGQIFYAGNLRTRDRILADEMEIATGDPFSLSKLTDSRRNILGLNALDSARLRTVGLKTEEEEVDIILEVSEKKPYFVEAGTGYDTERHLYVNAGIGDRNFTGRNLDLRTSAEMSQIGYKADVALTEPRFFSTRVLSHTRLFTEEREEFNKDFGIQTYGLSQDFLRTFRDKQVVTNLGFVYEFRDQYLTQYRELTEEEDDQYRTRHIGVISPGIIYKTTDSYVRPRKGIWTSANVDFSKGIDTDLDDFIKFRMDARYYYSLSAPLTLAVRGRYGYIQPYRNNTQVPEDQLFFLGGTTTVRGFDENMLRFDDEGNSVGGREMILGSMEARYDLGRNLEASLFYDIGSVARTQGRTESESFRDSIGLGLRYQTPVGPIGFLYGWKLDPEPGEDKGSFHFSMGYTF